MKNRVKNTILQNNLIEPTKNQHIVLGLSGGPDSVCLFHILMDLREEFNIKIHPVHVNHKFRPGEAEKDQEYVEKLCGDFNLCCYTYTYDCNLIAKEQGISGEEAGRNARYEAFYLTATEVMMEYNVGSDNIKIAVAQNLNDQAETLLMRIIRGTGTEGLAGIEYQRPGAGGTSIIRPLLDIDRDSIEKYCTENQLNPRIDHTNLQPVYTRNKIRLELIPYIKENFNHNISETLNRLSLIAKEDKDYMDSVVEQYLVKDLEVENYILLHPAIRKRIIIRNLEKIGLEQGIRAAHIEASDKLILEGKTGTSLNLPHGFKVGVSYGVIIFTKDEEPAGQNKNERPFDFQFKGMVLRNRQPGDYIILPGIGGRKKIQNLFVDTKVKREKRDMVPLLCLGSEVKWVIGDDISYLDTGLKKGKTSKDFIIEEALKERLFVEFNKKT